MEYIFGIVQRYGGVEREIVKTKGDHHTNLEGYQIVESEYEDRHITDTFLVLEKYHSAEDAEGNCYDWYYISDHNRDTDRFEPQKEDLLTQDDEARSMIVDHEYRMTLIELGIMEV